MIGVGTGALHASVSMGHPSGSYVTRKTKAWHVAQKLADIINTAGASVAGRFGPDQSGVIHAQAWASGPSTGGITLTFVLATGATSRYGKLGNLDRVFVAHGRTLAGVPVGSGQGFQWTEGSGATVVFADGDNNTKYHVTLDFTQPLLDKTRRGGSDERLPEDVHGLRAAIRERRAGAAGRLLPHGGRGHRPTRRGRWTTRRNSPAAGTSSARQPRSASNCCPWSRERRSPWQRGYEASTPGPGRLARA